MAAMNRQLPERLSDAQDFAELARALVAECEQHGQIHSLHLTHNKRAGTVSCVVELDSPKQQVALKRALGATGPEGSVYLEIPVCDEFAQAIPVLSFPPDMQPGFLPGGRASPLTA
jgi:hypothetical protein